MAAREEPPKMKRKAPPSKEELKPFMEERKGRMHDISWSDLDVQEVPVSSAVLIGASRHMYVQCKSPFVEFVVCRRESKDPRKCVKEGRLVTNCAMDFFLKVREHCAASFTNYWTCLDHNREMLTRCRKTQKVFDECMLEKLGIERPALPKPGEI